MKVLEKNSAIGGVVLLLLSLPAGASHAHLAMLQKRYSHQRLHNPLHISPRAEDTQSLAPEAVQKRDQCKFPTDAGLVAITPSAKNKGWAMSPDQQCQPNSYCPYACPPGQLMAQWDPAAKSYTYPESMNGGLYCDSSGAISKPFPQKPYCVSGTGALTVQNRCGKVHSVCQTVLPGSESMLIPTEVTTDVVTLSVPGPEYWCSTAAHYYHNTPGISIEEGCVWGDGSEALGNWAPYVSGANTDLNGITYAKIGWNPIYTNSKFQNTLPNWGLKFECDGCNGMPCSIDPSVNGVNQVTSPATSSGAGGANFCVVTIPKGVTATLTIFDVGGSNSFGSSGPSKQTTPASTVKQTPTSAAPSSTVSYTSTSTSSTTSSSSSTSSSTSSSSTIPTTSTSYSSSNTSTPFTTSTRISVKPHVLFENITAVATSGTDFNASTVTSASGSSEITATTASAPSATTSKSAAVEMLAPKSFGIGTLFVAAMAFAWL